MKGYILLFFLIVNIKTMNDDVSKAMACMAIVNSKLGISEDNINEAGSELFSTTILKCFLEITLNQANEIMNDIEQGIQPDLKSEKYKKLSDISDVNKFSENQIAKASEELMKAVDEFQNLRMEGNDDYEYEDDDYFGPSNGKGKNIFQLIFGGFKVIFNLCNIYEKIAIIFIIIFFSYRIGVFFYNKSNEKKITKVNENNEEKNKNEKEKNEDKESKKEEKNENVKEKNE